MNCLKTQEIKLKEGVSTGTCAAAAAKAAAIWLMSGACPAHVEVFSPAGRAFVLDVIPVSHGCCAVIKDAGDDPDATDGIKIFCSVEIADEAGDIDFKAAQGVGTVTLSGLKVPVGEAAINPVPRQMIKDALRGVIGDKRAIVTVGAEGGEEIAARTFNPRLGIVGGISILGTTGVVKPMDEASILASLSLELATHAEADKVSKTGKIIFTFANTGEISLRKAFGLKGRCVVQAGNYIGYVLDEAVSMGFENILVCGHPGKLLKVACGSFNTHNRTADGRLEVLCTHAAMVGAKSELIKELYESNTTETAIKIIENNKLNFIWMELAELTARRIAARYFGKLSAHAAFIDDAGAVLGQSACLPSFLEGLV